MAERALATAFVNIVPGTKDFDRYLKQGLGAQVDRAGNLVGTQMGASTGKSFAGKIKGLIGPALTAASIVAVGRFAQAAIVAAEDVQKANSRVEQINKSMGLFGDQTSKVTDRLLKYAEANELNLATDAEQIKLTQAKLLTFKNLALTADETGGAFDRATAAAIDLAAAGFGSAETNATQLGKALQDPIKGITALARSGVTFTQVEKDKIKALVESGNVLAAQDMVLKAIETQVGGTAAATATATEKMKLGLDNISESFGALLLSAFEGFVDVMNAKVVPTITGFFDAVKKGEGGDFIGDLLGKANDAIKAWIQGGGITRLMEQFFAFRQALIDTLITALPKIITDLANAIVAALPQVVSTLIGMVPTLIETAQKLFGALIQGLTVVVPNLITAIVNLLPKLVASITGMLPKIIQSALSLFMGLVQGLIQAIPKLIVALLDALPKIIAALLSMLPKLVTGAIQLFTGLVTGLIKMLPTLISTIVGTVLPKLITTIVALIPQLVTAGIQLFTALVTAVIKATPEIVKALVKAVPEMVKGLQKAAPQLLQAGKDLITGLAQGILKDGPKLIGEAMKGIGNAAIDTFKSLLGIASPSKVFKEFGKNILQGLVGGLSGDKRDIDRAMDEISKWITDKFEKGDLSQAGTRAARALVKAYRAELKTLEKSLEETQRLLADAQDDLTARIEQRLSYIQELAAKFGSTLTIEAPASADALAEAQKRVNEAQAEYNELVNEGTASASALKSAKDKLIEAEQNLQTVQAQGTTFEDAVKTLQERIAKTKELNRLTSQLVAMGINDGILKQIVEAQAVDFAQSILAGGQAAVDELNVLADEADAQALELATKVGDVLYNEGIVFAQSVVDELKKKENEIEATMKRVAKKFASEISDGVKVAAGLAKAAADDAKGAAKLANDAAGAARAAASAASSASSAARSAASAAASAVAKPAPKGGGGGGGSAMPWQFMAAGGFVTGPTPAIIGEAGPEVVTPLKDFERYMGLNNPKAPTVNYYAAPNNSLDAEQQLIQAMKRAKVVGAW
jgi:hypothetical protein